MRRGLCSAVGQGGDVCGSHLPHSNNEPNITLGDNMDSWDIPVHFALAIITLFHISSSWAHPASPSLQRKGNALSYFCAEFDFKVIIAKRVERTLRAEARQLYLFWQTFI